MSFILEDVRTFLISQNVSVGTSWPMYLGYIPDESDQMIAAFETGGYPPTEISRPNERVTLQVRIRAARLNYVTARQKWLSMFNAMQDSVLAMPERYIYVQTLHYGPITFNDDRGRSNFISNFNVMRVTETNSD